MTYWTVDEAKRIYENLKPGQKSVIFETGFGPSGLPHIGTLCEVMRPYFVKMAFDKIYPHIQTKFLIISDDMDGLRKIPKNLPNSEMLQENLYKPLWKIPDPFGIEESYAAHMNAKLNEFLDQFNIEYEFISSKDYYKSGKYNEALIQVAKNYDAILNLMLKTLGEERQLTYSPFLPICEYTGHVLQVKIDDVNVENATISYINEAGQEITQSFLDGNCKLQWKVDLGMRWYALSVDYEMYGKEHLPSGKLYSKICEILGGKVPIQYHYEMFLGSDGSKISKSKGNGLTVNEWLKYSCRQSILLFMFLSPKKAKRLFFDVIPKMTDQYISMVNNYIDTTKIQENDNDVENTLWYIENTHYSKHKIDVNYSMILNLVLACGGEDKQMIFDFLKKYNKEIVITPMIQGCVSGAINYAKDFIVREYRSLESQDIEVLKIFKKRLQDYEEDEDFQNICYRVGEEYYGKDNMRLWFQFLYEALLGVSSGPRFGSFIALYGVSNVIKLINDALNRKKL